MKKIRLAVLCPSEIAFRRFMPSVVKNENIEYIGIAHADEREWFGNSSENNNLSVLKAEKEKAENFIKTYGGKIFNSYHELLTSSKIDAVYIPLPPALHYKWAKLALENGKHVFLEKPSTTTLEHTSHLIGLAKEKDLAIHENYMFQFHSQIDYIKSCILENKIGEIRLLRIAFGFPFRGSNDFRYNKYLGGGALLDCGGYTVKLATMLSGAKTKMVCKQLNIKKGFDVDIYGSATMANDDGLIAQLSFGMDNSYKCELEVWGSNGTIYTNRIFTAPDGFNPVVKLTQNNNIEEIHLESDDSFAKSIDFFVNCVYNKNVRDENFSSILKQSELIEEFMK